MKFSEFAEYLQQLESTPKRLEITEILKNLIYQTNTEETRNAINLALGQLQAPFETQRFNMADKMVIRVLAATYQKTDEEINQEYNKAGDLGTVAENVGQIGVESALSINEVHSELMHIAQVEGNGSQEKKVAALAKLLSQLNPLSAKFVVRMVLGTTRLGFTSLTVIDALSNLIAGDKSLKERIEMKYNVYPDVALIAQKLKAGGMQEIAKISMQPGVPLMPQKPQRLATTEETVVKMGGKVIAEFKFDGTRVQLHLDRKRVVEANTQDLFAEESPHIFAKTFTRNLDDSTHQFPDIIEAAAKHIKADSIILDGEAIAYNKETGVFLPFQETIQRKRKHGVKAMIEQIPLQYLVFDILFLNGKEVFNEPYLERRELLHDVIQQNDTIKVDEHLLTEDSIELEEYFNKAKAKKLEGLVVKNPNDPYQAGARSFSWVKLKRLEGEDDTKVLNDHIDITILGYYSGRGARAKFGIGGFLAAVYDKENDSYKSVTKVGSGLTDEGWIGLKDKLDKISVKEKPANVEVYKELTPDVWVTPKIVVEVLADEITKSKLHTAEYALRFPRFITYRSDKKPEDATSLEELKQFFSL